MAIIYIRCCYPFYFVGEEKFRMISFLIIFVCLWLFPSIYNMIPDKIRDNPDTYFAKQICVNLTGLATCIIWRCFSIFPNSAFSTKSPCIIKTYNQNDIDNDDTNTGNPPQISDAQSSVSGHTSYFYI